jgi:hypothetical protein
MANNRLLIGNKESLDYMYIGKNYGDSWKLDTKGLETFIRANENICFDKINIELFTDSDKVWNKYMDEGEDIGAKIKSFNKQRFWRKIKSFFK